MTKPTIKQILHALIRQALVGKSYLGVSKGLLNADPVILDGARTFFGLTIDGGIEMAQMAIAKLYDRTRGAVTIPVLLKQAAKEIPSFQRDPKKVMQAIKNAESAVAGLQSILSAIHKRRNEWLAHIDEETVRDPAALAVKAKLSIPDLERAFQETEKILLELSSLYEGGTGGELHFLGHNDYGTALNWIRLAKCAFIENFEKKHGASSWNGLRPKDCSRHPWELV